MVGIVRRVALFTLLALPLYAQQVEQQWSNLNFATLTQEALLNSDPSLFVTSSLSDDPYGEATRYYNTPITVRRRSLSWWEYRQIYGDSRSSLSRMRARSTVNRVSFASRDLRVATMSVLWLRGDTSPSEMVEASIDGRTGRDLHIEGLFQNSLRATLKLFKKFNERNYPRALYQVAIQPAGTSRRQRHRARAIHLTGDNLYNPSWGMHNGKERSSQVVESLLPNLSLIYQHHLSKATTIECRVQSRYGYSSRSQLGWYDAYNPLPDYYRYLPSYMAAGTAYDTVEQVWREGDEGYTQIAWDTLEQINRSSADGESHYVVESRKRRLLSLDLEAIFSSRLNATQSCSMVWSMLWRSRNYKVMDDLLGGVSAQPRLLGG